MRTVTAVFVGAVVASAAGCASHDGTSPPPPDTVALLAAVPIPANYGIHDTFVRDGLAFVCAWNTGLLIYDVGNGIKGGTPANPVLVSSIVTGADGVAGGPQVHNAWWFWNPATGQKRYVFIGQEGPGSVGVSSTGDLHVVDVSDLAHPVEVGSYHMPDVAGHTAGAHNVWVDEANQVLYAAWYNGGAIAFDVSGDSLPADLSSRVLGTIKPDSATSYFWGVQLAPNGSLYATDMLNGLWQLSSAAGVLSVAGGGHNVEERFTSDLAVTAAAAYTGTWGNRSGHAGNVLKIWALGAGGAPSLADSIVTPNIGTVSDVKVSPDGTLLIFGAEGGSGNGLYVYSLAADPLHPSPLAFYPVATGVHTAKFGVIGGRLYVFAARDPSSPALLIFDVTGLVP